MTLNVASGTLTQPGATGNQTISLSTSFDPKWIMMTTTGLPSPAGTGANAAISWGVGTYRGAVVQQGFVAYFLTDAAATMNVNSDSGTDALLVLRPDGGTTARDLEIDLVSMSSNSVVVNWTNLFTTASIQVNYFILGGSAVSDALMWTFSVGTLPIGTKNATVVAGFGQPAVVMLSHPGDAFGIHQHAKVQTGWAKSNTEQRWFSYNEVEASTNAAGKLAQGTVMYEADESKFDGTTTGSYEMSARASWPTDGIQITLDSQNDFLDDMVALAVKGAADLGCTVGSDVSPTTVGTQDLTVEGDAVPKGIIMWGGNLPTGSGFNTSHADLGAWGFGFSDMTTQTYVGVSDDSGLGTSDTNRSWTDQVVWQVRGPSNALLAECTASVIGQVVRLNWTTVDATAREFNYIIFGEIAPVPVFEDPNLCAWGPPVPKISPLAT